MAAPQRNGIRLVARALLRHLIDQSRRLIELIRIQIDIDQAIARGRTFRIRAIILDDLAIDGLGRIDTLVQQQHLRQLIAMHELVGLGGNRTLQFRRRIGMTRCLGLDCIASTM